MIIHPSDGFDDWRSFLIGTLEPGGEYSSFLNDTNNLINEIIEFNSLLPPNAGYTESFLSETLVELINKIMNFTNIQQSEKTSIVKFIKKAQVLIPWAALNDRIDLFDSFTKLIDTKTPFYKFLSKGKETQELSEYFINHEFLTLISLRISKNSDSPITYDHINLLFKLMNNFPKMTDTSQINLFLTVTPIFAEMLKKFDMNVNFQSFHCNKFLETLQIFIKFTEIILGESTNEILSTSLDIGFSLLKMDAFDKQNLGASILTLFSSSKEKMVRESFFNFMKNKNFVADLMERDLHNEVLDTILPVFKLLVSSKQMNQNDLVQILHATTKVSFDQQETFFNLIVDAIKPLNAKDSISFFTKISPVPNQKGENENETKSQFDGYSIVFLKFSVLTLLKLKNFSHDLVKFIINQIVENASIHPNQNEVIEIVQQLCEKNVPEDIKYPLLKKCKSKFESNYSPFLISILTQLFNLNKSKNYSIDFDDNFFAVLQKHLFSANDKSYLYELFAKLLHNQRKKITNEMMNSILKDSKSDMLWNFLSQIIDNDGKNAFENDSFVTLQNFVNDYNEINSRFFLEFLHKIMIIVNVDAGNLKEKIISSSSSSSKGKTKLILVKTPLIFEQKLIDAINCNQEDLFKIVKSIFINLLKFCEPESLSIIHLLDLLNEKEKSLNLKDQNDRYQIYQFLRIIKSFCKKNGKSDKNRIIPHMLKISTEKQFYIARFKVTVSEGSEKFSFTHDIQSDIAIAFLVSSISPNLLYPLDRYKITLDGKDIFASSKVKYCSKDQAINITLLDQATENFSNDPTYILSKKGFSSKLLKYFEGISIKKNADQENDQQTMFNNKFIKLLITLLDNLPTDEKIIISTSDPNKFLHSLSKCKNPYQLKYMIQVLNWRLFSKKYLELYKKENILLDTLIKMCNKKAYSFSKSAEEFLELYKKLNCLDSSESVVPLLQIIAMKDIDSINKKEYILYLIKMKTNISDVFSNNPELLGDVIENINENNFETLWPYISKVKEFNPIYDMALSRLQKQTPNNIQFFTRIFFHYLSRISTNDIEKQLNSCIQLLIDSSMATAQSPVGIVSAMKQLVDNNTAKLASASGFINKLFVLINSGYPKDAQKMLYNICCSLSDISQENKVALISFIDSISSLKIEKWNILPDDDQCNSINEKHKGLRNLGSTCYMNSVLQQFYNIYAFDFLLANSKKETKSKTKDEQKSKKEEDRSFYFLQKLFCSLSITKRFSCDTKQFFDTWSQTHTHALPSEQHDATEFMQYFLGDMPESITSLYTGKITNFIESEDHLFKTQIDETFISIPISIDKYKSVEESLSSILNPQKLFGNNQYTKPDGVKVNAESYQKIKSCPPILIIQLARFKFNQSTKMREKINSRFEIADEINLSNIQIKDEANKYSSYTLNGVVVHRGDGNHGHYISYIKNSDYDPNDEYGPAKRWLRFDDMDVTEVDQKSYENEAFGSNLPQQGQFNNEINNMSGYLLFYIANGSSINFNKSKKKSKSKSKSKQETNQEEEQQQQQIITIPVLSENRVDYPKEIVKEVIHDNEIYLNEKSAFATPTFDFILEEANPTQLCDFFFKVFCHSTSKGKIVSSFEERIKNMISNDAENSELVDWLIKNVASIIPIFINCNSQDIINSVNNIITKSITTLSVEKGGKLVSFFVIYLHSCLEAWRQVFNISNIILSYLKIRKENVEYAINDNWPDSLVKFVLETYNGERQEYFLQNINISPVFDSLDVLLREDLKEIYQPLLSIYQQIQKSPSLKNYRNLIVHCASIEIFPIEEVVSIFPNELKDSNIMEIKFGKMNEKTDLEKINNSLKVANISQNKIIDYIYENRKKFKNYIIMNQNMNYLYNLFIINSKKIETIITENLENENNQEILMPFFDFIRSKMEETSKKENQNIVLSYLRIVLFMMKKINYPHDTNLEELNFFNKYLNTNEYIQISSYVGNPIILTFYDQQFPPKEEKKTSTVQAIKDFFTIKPPATTFNLNKDKQINDNFPSNEFFKIVRTILSSSDKVVDQFINKPNICDVVSKSVSTIKNQSDIELMVKFIEFLKGKQNKYQTQVPRILYAIVSGNDQNINYIISISKYFSDLINDLNFQEIASMLRIVDAIMRNGTSEQNDKAFQFFAPSILNYLENIKISFADLDTSKLTLNPDYIARYLSENSSVINIMVHLVTKIACLNVNFKKDSEKVFQRYLYYSNSSDGTGYYCGTLLVYYCFNDKNKKECDIVRYLSEMFKHLSRFHNEKWRNTFFKAFIDFTNNYPNSVPNWAKLLVNDSFKFASMTCDNEKAFFRIVFKEMNSKEFAAFLMNYSKSFSSDFYKMSWITSSDNKIKAINQLEQLVFLMNEFPDERDNIIQFLDIKKEWFRNLDFQKYKKLILPNV